MHSWEETISRLRHVLRLDNIKSKILVFALLATLIPSLTMGWLSYVQNTRSLTEKITEELRNVTSHTARELDLWLKERFYDLRVFSSSYEVTENLEKSLRARAKAKKEARALRRLKDYLTSVREKFIDYEELMVIDLKTGVVSTSAAKAGAVILPPDWLNKAGKDEAILGETYWDGAFKKAVIVIAVPIKAANGRFLGLLAAKLNFRTIDKILKSYPLGKTGQVYLITQDGALLTSSRSISAPFMETKLAEGTTQALFKRESASLKYRDFEENEVVGTLKRVPVLDWAVVAQIEKQEAYAQVLKLRNLTLWIVGGLLLGIGLMAYLLGLSIVRPLDRLTTGAAEVAAGDLEVDIPVSSRGEVGYMTQVFNNMVSRLRYGRDELAAINATLSEKNKELEELSITDGLTGLYNRKHLMETLSSEAARVHRHKGLFSILMIDIDHFKNYNDSFGHLAGDAVLTKMGLIFKESIRSVDFAARYGGEEFLIMLPQTGPDGAEEVADRIRARVASETSGDGNEQPSITISIGVAAFPEHGDTPEYLIASADAALYQAKRRGRNRVVRATGGRERKTKQRV
ncbi:MAG: diguanylate cyclase [Candidatus Methylomirabilales bacterium]